MMTNKKLNYLEVGKEAAILTAAVAIIAAAVFFFLSPSHTSVSSISGLGIVLSNFIPLPLSAITMILNIDHRLPDLRQRIRSKDRLYKHHAPAVSRTV